MSEITDKIKAYNDKKISFNELRDDLAARAYVKPSRFSDPERKKPPLWRAENYDPVEGQEGTWDEVDIAWAQHFLTDDEYQQICKLADKLNK